MLISKVFSQLTTDAMFTSKCFTNFSYEQKNGKSCLLFVVMVESEKNIFLHKINYYLYTYTTLSSSSQFIDKT